MFRLSATDQASSTRSPRRGDNRIAPAPLVPPPASRKTLNLANLPNLQGPDALHPWRLPPHLKKRLASYNKKPAFVERKIGYGDLDDWNALPVADQTRIRGHSVKLINSFKYTKWFLQMLGKFPFKSRKLEDGSYTFTINWFTQYVAVFLSMVTVLIFVLFSIGAVYIFIVLEPEHYYLDRCGNTWGKTVLSRNMPAVIFVWSQMMITAAGSLYILFHGQSFLEFYNVVNEAVMRVDADATPGIIWSNLRGIISYGVLFGIGITVTITGGIESLEEICVYVVECICYFFVRDIFPKGGFGKGKPFSALDFENLRQNCGNCEGCYDSHHTRNLTRCQVNKCFNNINTPPPQVTMVKYLGLGIIGYSLLGAGALIRQFEFFCQVVVNLAKVWNKRFLNYASKDNSISMEDPYRRRITNELIQKDHYEIVKLYNETEKNFSFILFVYYASSFFSLICQFYYIALLTTQTSCATAVQREREAALAGKCYADSVVNNTREVLEDGLDPKKYFGVVSFEDPCNMHPQKVIRHASLTTIILLIITVASFVVTTLHADRASHQADIGFYRVRRRGYMSCRTKQERNAMHALVFSFTGPKKFCMTAGGYLEIRKKTIVVVISVAFVYFLIILSFKPGQILPIVRCWNLDKDNNTKLVIGYPKVI